MTTALWFLAEWALRSSILILAGALVLRVLRVKEARVRLAAWTALLCGSLLIPALTATLPPIRATRGLPSRISAPPLPPGASRPTLELEAPAPTSEAPPSRAIGHPEQVTPKPAARTDWNFDWRLALAVVYAFVTAVLLGRLGSGLILSHRLIRRSRPAGIEDAGIQIRESDELASPAALGILSPAIVVPSDWRQWDREKLRAVLAHEGSHVRRHDPLVQLLSAIHRALLWPTPLSWFLHRSIVRVAEEASDDAAVATATDPASYAEILLEFMGRGVHGPSWQGVPMARYGCVESRIQRILDTAPLSRGLTRAALTAVLAFTAPLVWLAASVEANGPQQGASAQPATKPLTFEAADVHARPADRFMSVRTDSYMSGGLLPSGRYELHTANMANLIETAYGLQNYEVYGGPDWLETEHYELIAKATPGARPEDVKLMLQALLADRFNLVVHKAEEPVYANALTLGKSGLLKESEGTGEADCSGGPGGVPSPYVTINCQHMTMADFAKSLGPVAGSIPMVDLTGLKGAYDFSLKWTPPGRRFPSGSDADAPRISFAEAVEKQLGLKIVTGRHPVPVLVVDRVNRTPTPNTAGTGKALGDATEFEAASVKPSRPGDQNRKFQITRGRVEVENVTLKSLIAISANQLALVGVNAGIGGLEREANFERDIIVGGPKWIETESFDIVAKTADATPGSPELLPDHMAVMLRNLLAERFKLVTHTEQRPVPVWTLVVGKGGPKLTPADPKSRSGCKWSKGEVGTGSAAASADIYACRNVTMGQLAETLHSMNGAYVDHAAVDMTGLKGGYDFTISVTPLPLLTRLRAQSQTADAGGVPQAETPVGMTMFEAIEKLGLKLEGGHKAPMPVIVIDHVEQPVAN